MVSPNRRTATIRDVRSSFQDGPKEYAASCGIGSAVPPTVVATSKRIAPPGSASYCLPASKASTSRTIPLYHIPNLAMAEACRQTLEKIWKEFEPIIQRRGYNVKSISELCCCGDGLDSQPGRRRRLRKQSDNVWGYNQTSFFRRGRQGSKSHTIHLRLRQPRNHDAQLLSWEDVAGTMAHELSHCLHQNHSKEFYKLMEEILEEHATLQVQNMGNIIYGGNDPTSVTTNMPETVGQRLGGSTNNISGNSRLLEWDGNIHGQHLNGGKSTARRPLSPRARRDAMARAAEKRRRQMDQLKRMIEASKEPCVIEILDDPTDENDPVQEVDRKPTASNDSGRPSVAGTTNRRPRMAPQRTSAATVIDITAFTPQATKRPRTSTSEPIDLTSPPQRQGAAIEVSVGQNKEGGEWACSRCTFRNPTLALTCEVCHGRNEETQDNTVIELG